MKRAFVGVKGILQLGGFLRYEKTALDGCERPLLDYAEKVYYLYLLSDKHDLFVPYHKERARKQESKCGQGKNHYFCGKSNYEQNKGGKNKTNCRYRELYTVWNYDVAFARSHNLFLLQKNYKYIIPLKFCFVNTSCLYVKKIWFKLYKKVLQNQQNR